MKKGLKANGKSLVVIEKQDIIDSIVAMDLKFKLNLCKYVYTKLFFYFTLYTVAKKFSMCMNN